MYIYMYMKSLVGQIKNVCHCLIPHLLRKTSASYNDSRRIDDKYTENNLENVDS